MECKENKSTLNEISSTTSNAIRNNVIPFVSFKGQKTPKTIEEIILHLNKEYGIEADFSNLETAKLTLETVEDLLN